MIQRGFEMMSRRILSLTLVAALALPSASALAAGVAPASASAVQRTQAQAKFLKGKELFSQKKYPEALEQFRASLDIIASPNARLFVARALRESGSLLEAYGEFGRTAAEAKELAADPRYAKAGESAIDERKELEAKLGLLSVTIEHPGADTTLIVAGQTVQRAAWAEPAPVMPGTIEIVVTSPGKEPIKKSVTITAGEKQSLSIDAAPVPVEKAPPPPAAPPPTSESSDGGGMRTAAFVAGGVGAAGLLTFAIFGAVSNGKYNGLQSTCGSGRCPASSVDDIAAGKRDQRIANIGLVVGIVGLGAGVTLFVLSTSSTQTKETKPVAELVVGPGSVLVQGAF
jgi:hypothetical protein